MEFRQVFSRDNVIRVIFASMMVGWGAKLLTFIIQSNQGYWHYFPVFPNVVDAIFMFVIALYLVWGKLKEIVKIGLKK